MMNRKAFYCGLIFLLFSLGLSAQNITSEGKDFWFGFMQNNPQQNQPVELKVYISATDTVEGKLEIPKANWSTTFKVLPNTTTQVIVPTNTAMAIGSGNREGKALHLTADDNVTVYALNSRAMSADASVILPVSALGKTYYVTTYIGTPPSLPSEFMIVAAEENTEVEITPSVNTLDGRAAGVPYKVTLGLGELMQVQSTSDLTGTKITASGSCKPFAAYGGNQWTNVGNCGQAQDHLYEQLFPVTTWGKNYATVPYQDRSGGDVFKILASEDNTRIQITGLADVSLNKGKFTTLLIANPVTITADKPIQVAQLSRSQNCDNRSGDPFMIMLSPIEQTLNKITFNAFNVTIIQNYYVNIITRTAGVDKLKLDGQTVTTSFSPYSGNSAYSFAQIKIAVGNHTLESPDGFLAYVYGFGNIESFGYATGAKLDNLNMTVTAKNQSNEITTAICARESMRFTVSSLRSFTRYQWNFNGQIKTGNEAEYFFADGGNYFVTVTGFNVSDNCSDAETATIRITVREPNEKIRGTASVCPQTAGVSYSVNPIATNTYQWFVEGGIITQTGNDNIKIDWGNTNDKARVRVLAKDGYGCYGDTISLAVRINVKLSPALPMGIDSLCSSARQDVAYEVFTNPTSLYTWSIENGQINSGQGTSKISVSWNGAGLGSLSYLEESVISSICSGKSEKLAVFIEQEPNEKLTVVLPKQKFQVEEPIVFEFSGDPLFNYKTWNFGNGAEQDSVSRTTQVKYNYKCPGEYTVSVSAYTGTVCKNLGRGNQIIEVVKPELEIRWVSHVLDQQNQFAVSTVSRNTDFFSGGLSLERREIDPSLTAWSVLDKNHRKTSLIDKVTSSHRSVYQYQYLISSLCGVRYSSRLHNTIRLTATKDSTEISESGVLNFNDYNGWINRPLRYELYQSIDSTTFTSKNLLWKVKETVPYENVGFKYDYRIRAVSEEGFESWSNATTLTFVPKVFLYNVITPNGDQFNDEFIIEGIENYPDNDFVVYNRYGHPVFKQSGYMKGWRGQDDQGRELSTGVYFFILNLQDERARQKIYKGTVSVLR